MINLRQSSILRPEYFAIVIIAVLSFFYNSALFYPGLNSDNAISVLMIYYFDLPHDFYFWGQDRMGSLIPLLGQIPFRLLGLSAILSESIVHYAILISGYLAFASFIKSDFLKIAFALMWFFPPWQFIDITQFAYGIGYSLIAIICYLIESLLANRREMKIVAIHAHFTLIILCIIIAIWVIELALISIIVLFPVLFYSFRKEKFSDIRLLVQLIFAYGVLGTVIGVFLIVYMKSFSEVQFDYAIIADVSVILQTLGSCLDSVINVFLFRNHEVFTSVWAYFSIAVIAFILVRMRQKSFAINRNKIWITFFLVEAIVLYCVIVTSEWTAINKVPKRYFTCTYVSISFVVILLLDEINLQNSLPKKFKWLLLLAIVTGSAGTMYFHKFIWPGTLEPKTKVIGEFEKLGEIGIIGDFWNSYLISSINPGQIKAIPAEFMGGRNNKLTELVFSQKRIYLVRDMWLEQFPDSIWQYGRLLHKEGEEFIIGNSYTCEYSIEGRRIDREE